MCYIVQYFNTIYVIIILKMFFDIFYVFMSMAQKVGICCQIFSWRCSFRLNCYWRMQKIFFFFFYRSMHDYALWSRVLNIGPQLMCFTVKD
ncbi:hypothetical protein AQUCO_06600003v1 [Aquilegia coerulea]|uniref:Uncharacterized protein n=1 Tax=Aquilegia coerulea TaxID=218851 RepID=A0A2G5CC09_AQUCA|nr:hypothetical protein AQUCO_06600003v1 [Aquilegia coerulea]